MLVMSARSKARATRPFLNIRVARDSAGAQTGQTRIVSCDRVVSTTIYPIWGLPINQL
jgi:hypothetical protein